MGFGPTPVKSKAGRQMVPRAGVTVERMKLGAVMRSEDSEDASSHWASPAFMGPFRAFSAGRIHLC